MAYQSQADVLRDNPLGKGLDAFHASFRSLCERKSIPCTPDALHHFGRREAHDLSMQVLGALYESTALPFLPSRTGCSTLRSDLVRLELLLDPPTLDFNHVNPLLKAAILHNQDDASFWEQVYRAVPELNRAPQQLIASPPRRGPWLHRTRSYADSLQRRQDLDRVLKSELGSLYVGLPQFHNAYFGRVAGLETISKDVFRKCTEGSYPLFSQGWSGWPPDANQDGVLSWFADVCEKLAAFAKDYRPTDRLRRVAQSFMPLYEFTAEHKLDIGLVDTPEAGKYYRCHWSRILVPGELKSNPLADSAPKGWMDLGIYAREVLAAQHSRRFVLGFTLCGSLMRVWEFDRLGALASQSFDIHKHGQQFVFTILGFLLMSPEELGFDPTIMAAGNKAVIDIQRDGSTERLILDEVLLRAHHMPGRATTCWRGHREGHPQVPLVIKDSWQDPGRDEEGELLREVTSRGVVNVARYYHHETVQVRGTDDDVQSNVRRGLDVTAATNYPPRRSRPSPSMPAPEASRGDGNNRGRSSGQVGASLPTSKPSFLEPSSNALPNRVHRRVIVRDFGKPIYEASSRSALLTALEGSITGHESLHRAGLLHRDISANNIMVNENEDNANPSWPSFLIDLDLAISEQQLRASGIRDRTGTRAFMAIGLLLGEQHSFMHDLESFFWVLFWICIHYNHPSTANRPIYENGPTEFDEWDFAGLVQLAELKRRKVCRDGEFISFARESFTLYYQPLIPWVNRLRRVVFPNGRRWVREDERLYGIMRGLLAAARRDPEVSAGE